ncbi:MAG: phosphoserine phosphatase SerB [Deltaproteobacteria bacterium]|nr:MAG: phosphoserine phosphatase SerB [Deltaproteobacteria bacterium]
MGVLVTVTGSDHPGITAALASVLADHGVALEDIEQVVVHGRLTLCLLLDLPGTDSPALRDLLFRAKELGLALDFESLPDARPRPPTTEVAVTALANPISPVHLTALARVLAHHEANIRAIDRLSARGLSALELKAEVLGDGDRLARLRHALLELAIAENVDLAVQPLGLARRSLRLVAMDMDSTLIQVEVIDELARAHGVGEQVARITAEAMAGDLDYEQSLRKRVSLLEGLSVEAVEQVADGLPLTDGAETLVRTLKRLGCKTAVISGGFDVAARRVQQRLGLDHAHSNALEVVDGRLTGRVLEPIVTPERKVQLLEQIAAAEGIPLTQTVAIGDGANDLMMIERAGLGIAFHAKARLRAAADTALTHGGLDRVLYLLGVRDRELDPA